MRAFLTPILILCGLGFATFIYLLGQPDLARILLVVILSLGSLPFILGMWRSLQRGELGIDLIAAVGILASLLVGEYFTGCIILLMLSGGSGLETYAVKRARKGLSNLLSLAPTKAHRKAGEILEDIPASAVKIGDIVVIKQGEIVPVDGIIIKGSGLVDESALTGESLPVTKHPHSLVLSGAINLDQVIEVKALRASKESKYAQIIKLVQAAELSKAPFVRLADRYSVFFTIVTFAFACLAWVISQDPKRALAVLVVATPCPLILAAPIAFASGISRAASRGIIVKFGEAMEKLSKAKSILFDKTGTLTLGTPKVDKTISFGTYTRPQIIKISASLDQLSTHILAQSLIEYARAKHAALDYPEGFDETMGQGVTGKIDGTTYFLGSLSYLKSNQVPNVDKLESDHETLRAAGTIAIYLATKKKVVGIVYFRDQIRPHVKQEFIHLSKLVDRIIMATGDRKEVADQIASQVGIKEVKARCMPQDKLDLVALLAKSGPPVVMVGDGVNDAPALAAADVGIVMGSKSSTSAHDAGDILIAVDDFSRVGEIIVISKHVMRIAKQCIYLGMGLSIVLMVLASGGYIRPPMGALLQEIIDVLVILNALRVGRKRHTS